MTYVRKEEYGTVAEDNIELDQLSDVDITTPGNGESLIFDGGGWTNQFQSLAGLADTDITSPVDGDVLVYDGTNFINSPREPSFIRSGFITFNASGTQTISGLGFQPQTIIFFLTTRITTANFEETPATNQSGVINAFGSGTGLCVRDENDNLTQSAQFIAPSSSSINSHTQGSTNTRCILIYETDNNGTILGRVDGEVSSITNDGFVVNTTTFTMSRNVTMQYLAIPELRGPKGEQGDQGLAGADGDLTWEGEWQFFTTYTPNQVVQRNGSSYVAITTNTNSNPAGNPSDWELLAAKGDTGTGSTIDVSSEGTLVTTATEIDFSNQFEVTENPSGVASVQIQRNFFAGYNSNSITLSSVYQDIPINVEMVKDSIFTHAANSPIVTITRTGRYKITAEVTTDITNGANRSECQIRLVEDTGSGITPIPGSVGLIYNRTVGRGGTTASATIIRNLNASNSIRMQVVRNIGSDTIITVPEGSRLIIEEL